MKELLREIRDEMKAQTAVLSEMSAVLNTMSVQSALASEEARRRLQDTASFLRGTPFEGMARNLMTAVKE